MKKKKAFSLIEVTIVLALFIIIMSASLMISDYSMRKRRQEVYYQVLKQSYKELTLLDLKEDKIQDITDEGTIVIYDNEGNTYYGTVSDKKIIEIGYFSAESLPDFNSMYSNSIGFKGETDVLQEYDYVKNQMKANKTTFYWD